jgi:lysophospholipase L1-like esterase
MIGTNDVNGQVDLPNAPTRLAALIDLVTTTAPDALLVVAQLVPTRTDSLNADVRAFNAAIPALVSERVKAGKHILVVDMYGAFTANPNYKTDWLFDGLHPNGAGYEVMAKTWYDAIGAYFNQASTSLRRQVTGAAREAEASADRRRW